jgi:hypothetical protein
MKRNEFLIVAVLISFAALFISNKIQLPSQISSFLNSKIGKIILIILTLYAFSISPAIGMSSTVLTAIIIFDYNVYTMNNLQSQSLFSNPITNFVRNLFTPTSVEGKLMHNESAEYAEMVEQHHTEGSYPFDEQRPANYESSLEYNYRPQSDTGSDDFVRDGPNIDEKPDVLHE